MDTLFRTDLPLPNRREGKVRDLYDLPPKPSGAPGPSDGPAVPRLLIVATDRVSAFDVVMPTPIPGKGTLLTEVSTRWFAFITRRKLAPIHLLSGDAEELVGAGLTAEQAATLRGRIMIARRCRVIPVECVVRGYLDGSGWTEYRETGRVCGVALPPGLLRGSRLPEPIFTPATKEAVGTHDENIDFERACAIAGDGMMMAMRAMSLAIYAAAHEHADTCGLILADTKFEFGIPLNVDGGDAGKEPILVDEALTPDSSRYWDKSAWKPGGEQPGFDKQFLREFLNGLTARGAWRKQPPGPALPPEVVEGTRSRYEEVRRRLFGA